MGLWTVEDYGVVADKACWAMFAVTALVVALRVFTRIFFSRGVYGDIGLDDWITVFCVALILATCVIITIGSHHGLGRHMATLDPQDIVPALKWNVIISSILIWTFSLPKFAIIAILKRILNYGTKTAILFWFLALSSQACILATSVWWFKQCTPVEYGWDRSIPGGSCAPVKILADLGYFTSAYSAFLDIFFALYPIPFIMRLNMPLKSRIAVSVALGLSVLACIVSIYKLSVFGKIFEILALDPTYPVPFLDILGLAEGCILIICASLPTLGPIIRFVKRQVGGSIDASRDRSRQRGDNSHGQSGTGRSGGWRDLKGNEADDPEQASSAMHSSVDDIPLVSSKTDRQSDIHKTTQFTMVSERTV